MQINDTVKFTIHPTDGEPVLNGTGKLISIVERINIWATVEVLTQDKHKINFIGTQVKILLDDLKRTNRHLHSVN